MSREESRELLQRLHHCLSYTWRGWSRYFEDFHFQLDRRDFDETIRTGTDILGKLAAMGDWSVIPSILDVVNYENLHLREAAITAVEVLCARIPLRSLPAFELQVRSATYQAMGWHQWRPWDQPWNARASAWSPSIWALLTMHPSGYVREAAIRHISLQEWAATALPYLLLRVNDWVPAVRIAAEAVLRSLLVPQHQAEWAAVLGMLEALQCRSRADHAWLTAAVRSLMLQPECRGTLRQAITSRDRMAARWALSAAITLPSPESPDFLHLALDSDDPVTRFRAAGHIRRVTNLPARAELLKRTHADPSMPVRREALYAALEADAHTRRTVLLEALFDRHASMRHAARFYLKEDAGAAKIPFDARSAYGDAIDAKDTATRRAAIAGLGESGLPEDAERLKPLVHDSRNSAAVAAVRAIAALARDSNVEFLANLIADPRPGVSKWAARSLSDRPHAVPCDVLRSIMQSAPCSQSSRHALQLLLARGLYDALPHAVLGATSDHEQTRRLAIEFIQGRSDGGLHGPTASQCETVTDELARAGDKLPSEVVEAVRRMVNLSPPA